MRAAVDGSLRRLRTDYIDLYQLHWPNRGSYHFRQMWRYAPTGADRDDRNGADDGCADTAQALVAEGKIRAIGLSNESVWGAARWLHLAETLGLPRMASVQNEYSLLCRQFDTDWAEFSLIEDMPLLAFSPLAVGLLSGKYAGDVTPEGSRRSFTPDLGGRITPQVFQAVAAYLGIAARHGLDPCQMAIAFCRSRPFTHNPDHRGDHAGPACHQYRCRRCHAVGRGAGRHRRGTPAVPRAVLIAPAPKRLARCADLGPSEGRMPMLPSMTLLRTICLALATSVALSACVPGGGERGSVGDASGPAMAPGEIEVTALPAAGERAEAVAALSEATAPDGAAAPAPDAEAPPAAERRRHRPARSRGAAARGGEIPHADRL